MAEQPTPQSWWQTLPGIITATAAFITAITGLLVALHQAGVFQDLRKPSIHIDAPIDRALKKLDWGNIAFNTPERIGYGETKGIQLLLTTKLSRSALEKMVAEDGVVESDRIKISNSMAARLVGEAFEITPITPETQHVSTAQVTEWKWDIRPKRIGSQRLHLSINAFVVLSGNDVIRSVRTFDRTISVYVLSPGSAFVFAQDNWAMVAGGCAALVAILSAIYARLRKSSKASPSAST